MTRAALSAEMSSFARMPSTTSSPRPRPGADSFRARATAAAGRARTCRGRAPCAARLPPARYPAGKWRTARADGAARRAARRRRGPARRLLRAVHGEEHVAGEGHRRSHRGGAEERRQAEPRRGPQQGGVSAARLLRLHLPHLHALHPRVLRSRAAMGAGEADPGRSVAVAQAFRPALRAADAALAIALAPCASCAAVLESPLSGPICEACWAAVQPAVALAHAGRCFRASAAP